MAITLNGTTGITNDGGYTGDGVSFADNTPANTLVTDTSGNVGIGGLPVANNQLTLYRSTFSQFRMQNATTGTGTSDGFRAQMDGVNTTITNHEAGYMAFETSDVERMRISSAGLVSVGTAFGGSRLQSKGIGGVAAAAGLSPGNNGDGTLEWYNATSGYVGAVTVNASTVVYGGTSDYRLKENIAPMTGALARVSLLKPVTYTWKVDGESGEGFIAHELQEICPSAVVGEKDALNKDGSIKPQQVDTSFLVATLTAAIQELKTELDSVKAELATLKGAA